MSGSRLTTLVDREVDGMEDLTAGELFHQLRDSEDTTSAESDEVYRKLVDEPPEEFVRGDRERDADRTHDDVLADDEAVESLLLSDQTEANEFQWIDTASDLEDSDAEQIDDETDRGEADEIVDVQDWDVSFERNREEPAGDGEPERTAEPEFDPSSREPEPRSAHPRAVTDKREELPPIVDEDPENIAVPVVTEGDSAPPAVDRNPDPPDGVLAHLKRLFGRLF